MDENFLRKKRKIKDQKGSKKYLDKTPLVKFIPSELTKYKTSQ